MNTPTDERVVRSELELDADPETVWNALTDAAEISRWFSFEARSEPGPGGSVWLSWGPECQGTADITLWEPPHRLRTADRAALGQTADGQVLRLTTEYELEGSGGRTRLRIVTAGFGAGDAWEDEYDSISRGWEVFMRCLSHYLARHSGTPRQVAFASLRHHTTREEAWARLFAREGLLAQDGLGQLEEGGGYALRTREGDWSGTAQVVNHPKDLALTIAELNDAHLWVEITGRSVNLTLSTYGLDGAKVETIQSEWRALLGRLFPQNAEASA